MRLAAHTLRDRLARAPACVSKCGTGDAPRLDMTRFSTFLALSFALASGACVPRRLPPPEAPPWRGAGAYEPRSMTHFGGEVISVDDVRATDAAFSGLHALVRAEKGAVSVHLGPKRFFDERDFSIMPGDMVEVTGVVTQYGGDPAGLATAVKKGKAEVRLPSRDGSLPNAH